MMAAKIAGAGLGLGLKMMLGGGDFGGDFGGADYDFSGGYDFGGDGGCGYQPTSADWFALNNAPCR